MKGHGWRTRTVVSSDPAVVDGREKVSWVRRYICNACGVVIQVTPEGILKRILYALEAIIRAWLAVMEKPLGEGLTEEESCERHGRTLLQEESGRGGAPRWRALSRWASRIEAWWPGRAVAGSTWRERVRSLLSGFLVGGGGVDGLLVRALNAHLGGGAAM
jgi:hypothetical protein